MLFFLLAPTISPIISATVDLGIQGRMCIMVLLPAIAVLVAFIKTLRNIRPVQGAPLELIPMLKDLSIVFPARYRSS